MSTGKKSFVCSICHCKHQSARGQQCKQLKHNLPIFTSFVRAHDVSHDTSFAHCTDESLESVFAIRRIMAFMHSNAEVYRAWSLENPTLEIGLESSVIASDFGRTEPTRPLASPVPSVQPAMFNVPLTNSFLPEPEQQRGSLGGVQFEVPQPHPVAAVATSASISSSEKGPAPPCLSYEFLSKAPKITVLTLKK